MPSAISIWFVVGAPTPAGGRGRCVLDAADNYGWSVSEMRAAILRQRDA
jgi:hypothetical protein